MNSVQPGRLTEVRFASQRGSHISYWVYDRLAGTAPNTHRMPCLDGGECQATASMRTPLGKMFVNF